MLRHRARTLAERIRHDRLDEEAFAAIGGAAELRRHAAVSARLEAVVGDPELDEELRKLLPRDYGKRKGFSTRLVNQHFIKTLEELYEQANVVHEKFDDVVRALAAETGGRAVVPPVKGEVRARMKAFGAKGRPPAPAASMRADSCPRPSDSQANQVRSFRRRQIRNRKHLARSRPRSCPRVPANR